MRYSNCLFTLFPLLLAVASSPVSAGGQPAAEDLQQLLEPINSLQAGFTQVERGEDGEVIADLSQKGHMKMSRPGRMRWTVEGEFGQQVITNGETLWLYDPDLEQVTVQSVGEDTLALLLVGDFQQLSGAYDITRGEAADSFILKPREPSDTYQQVTFAFDNRLPKSIAVLNNLGEQTVIEFQRMELNPSLDPAQFNFQTPEGVEEIVNL